MSALRVTSMVSVRSDVNTLRGVSTKTGKEWVMRFQQVLDSDSNKVELSLPDALAPMEAGAEYDLVLDVEVDRRNTPNARIITATRVPTPAGVGSPPAAKL